MPKVLKTVGGRDYIFSGKINRPFGLKGELLITWNNGRAPVEPGEGVVYIEVRSADVNNSKSRLRPCRLLSDKRHARFNIVALEGINSREDARTYTGGSVWVLKEDLSPLGRDEYYVFQLVGMRVETIEGEYLGEIAEVFSNKGADIYMIKRGKEEILIPAIGDIIREVDVKKGVMKVRMMEEW
jgi:16S rRNA processing protein RimM